jgi:HK97 gp10 family phage protein
MARLHSDLTRIAAKCPQAAEAALELTARDILTVAQALSPVDTGAMRDSGAVETPSPGVRHVGFGVEYAPFNEYGTVNMPATPFLTPAFLQSQSTFNKRLTEEMKKIIG